MWNQHDHDGYVWDQVSDAPLRLSNSLLDIIEKRVFTVEDGALFTLHEHQTDLTFARFTWDALDIHRFPTVHMVKTHCLL